MEMLQPNINVSESVDSSERPISKWNQLHDEIGFLREELKNKNNKSKSVLGQLSKRDGTVSEW